MKKLLTLLCVSLFAFAQVQAVDSYTEVKKDKNETVVVKDSYSTHKTVDKKDFKKEMKKLKRKAIFDKLNPFKKAKSESDTGLYILAFAAGFLFGLIGILVIFLIFLKHENRKKIMRFAWLGWLYWLVVLCLIFAIATL